MIHYNVVVSGFKCLLMYLPATLTPSVGIHKWRQLYKQMINDNIVKESQLTNTAH